MSEPLPILLEKSLQIAWDYLERTVELGDPDAASRMLLDSIQGMITRGETRRLLLSNRAIDAYRKFKVERHPTLIS
jgi:hypothetical protein